MNGHLLNSNGFVFLSNFLITDRFRLVTRFHAQLDTFFCHPVDNGPTAEMSVVVRLKIVFLSSFVLSGAQVDKCHELREEMTDPLLEE